MSDLAARISGSSSFSALVAAGAVVVQTVKLNSGVIVGIDFANLAAAASFLRFYDLPAIQAQIPLATIGFAPTAAQLATCTPKLRFSAPSTSNLIVLAPTLDTSVSFYGGIYAAVSGGSPDNDATAVAANGCFLNVKFV